MEKEKCYHCKQYFNKKLELYRRVRLCKACLYSARLKNKQGNKCCYAYKVEYELSRIESMKYDKIEGKVIYHVCNIRCQDGDYCNNHIYLSQYQVKDRLFLRFCTKGRHYFFPD